jgi:hypothetical protein
MPLSLREAYRLAVGSLAVFFRSEKEMASCERLGLSLESLVLKLSYLMSGLMLLLGCRFRELLERSPPLR